MSKQQYRVFYSRDCMMYGIETYNQLGGFWQQALPPNGYGARRGQSAYTYYRGVAQRWADTLNGVRV